MPDTTIKKVEARSSPRGEMSQKDSSPASAFRCASGLTSPVENSKSRQRGTRKRWGT